METEALESLEGMFMKSIIVFFIILALCAPLYAADFRKASWGMSKQEVIQSEGKEPFQEGTSNIGSIYASYLFTFRVGETTQEMLAVYYFIHNALYFAKYRILTIHSNQNAYLEDFEIFQNSIEKKYGSAEIKLNWKDSTFRSEKDLWGTAISFGGLEKTAFWNTETTMILLCLDGDNGEIRFEIRYSTKDLRLKSMVDALKESRENAQF